MAHHHARLFEEVQDVPRRVNVGQPPAEAVPRGEGGVELVGMLVQRVPLCWACNGRWWAKRGKIEDRQRSSAPSASSQEKLDPKKRRRRQERRGGGQEGLRQ